MRFRPKRHTSVYRGAVTGLRLDENLAVHQMESLPHADESKAATVDGVLRVKANPQVIHGQLYLCRCSAQFHLKVPLTAVLDCILQGFL